MNYNITVIRGDGVGSEIVTQGIKVLEKIGEVYGHSFKFVECLAGGVAIDEKGISLPPDTVETCKQTDSILFGAVGGPKWDNPNSEDRPEKALLRLRKELGLFANLRPAILFDELKEATPLKEEKVAGGLDILVVRELTGGIYFGEKKTEMVHGEKVASDIEKYSESEIKRIAIKAFEFAQKRNKKLTSVDKANVLESSRLWRKVVTEISENYKDVTLNHMYVDNMAMQLVLNPKQFDVILTNNIFGDILSDEASQIVGSIGLLPSASIRDDAFGMYEPIHGSAPDIAGKDIVNPIATIMSCAMMLEYSFSLTDEANAIKTAVSDYLSSGHRTLDIHKKNSSLILDGTKSCGSLIAEKIK